jgi:aminoglycoside phosphotransferase (APT) family kinase protein
MLAACWSNTENICRAADGGVIVLDWENSGPAQPERELAAVIADLAADLGPRAAQAAHAAYQANGGPAALTATADFAMAAAIQGHLLRFYSRRALDPAEPAESTTRARARLDHMLRQPLTLAQARHLLDLTVQPSRSRPRRSL